MLLFGLSSFFRFWCLFFCACFSFVRETLLLAEVPEEELCMCIRNGITMSPVGNRRGAVFRVPLLRRCTHPGSSEERWQGGYGSTHCIFRVCARDIVFWALFRFWAFVYGRLANCTMTVVDPSLHVSWMKGQRYFPKQHKLWKNNAFSHSCHYWWELYVGSETLT